ncbi:hypothetical protein [Acidisoma sp. 7E03]
MTQAGEVAAWQGPHVAVGDFDGPLGLLLDRVRTEGRALEHLPVHALVTQLLEAMQAPVPLPEKADWLIMAARIVEWRARLLLPAESDERRAAEADAVILRDRLLALDAARRLAAWLDNRPQLGRDLWPARLGEAGSGAAAEPDVIEFLWASIAVFEGFQTVAAPVYSPQLPPLHSVADAAARILQRLKATPGGLPLPDLLPPPEPGRGLRARSRWTSTFAAGLELAKQGRVTLSQEGTTMRLQARARPDPVRMDEEGVTDA